MQTKVDANGVLHAVHKGYELRCKPFDSIPDKPYYYAEFRRFKTSDPWDVIEPAHRSVDGYKHVKLLKQWIDSMVDTVRSRMLKSQDLPINVIADDWTCVDRTYPIASFYSPVNLAVFIKKLHNTMIFEVTIDGFTLYDTDRHFIDIKPSWTADRIADLLWQKVIRYKRENGLRLDVSRKPDDPYLLHTANVEL